MDIGGDFLDFPGDAVERLSGLANQRHARLHLLSRRGDELLDFLGGRGRSLRQFPDFLGDDGKPPPGLAGTGSLDPGIQSQQVGLKRDLVNHADDPGDVFR